MNYNYMINISSCFFIVFLLGSALNSLVENTIEWLNTNKGNINNRLKDLYKIHPLMKKYFTKNKILKTQEYNNECQCFFDFKDSLSSGINFIIMLFGIAPFLLNFIIISFPSLPTTIHYIFFFIITKIFANIIDIPFDMYETFKIESKYGFNTTSKDTFLSDILKSFLLNIILTSLGIAGINHILIHFGPFSAYKICYFVGGLILVGLIMEYMYMTVFIRLFNKLTPLKDKKLSKRIKNLMEKYGYKTNSVFVMDASKRSTKSNAFIGGIGNSKKIILFDTLLDKYTHDELIAILGHELAHGKLHHLLLNRTISAIITLISTYFIFKFAYNIELYHTFGFTFITEDNIIQYSLIGFALASMIVSSIKWVLSPIDSYISRRCEYAADKYSVKYTRKKNAMISALIKLTSENMGDIFPNKYYEAYSYSHPSLINRIKALIKN